MIISDVASGTYTARIGETVLVDAQDPVEILLPPSEPGESIEVVCVNSEEAIALTPAVGEKVNGATTWRYGAPDLGLTLRGVPGGWRIVGFYQQLFPPS